MADGSGKRLESVHDVQAGEEITVRISDGKLTAQVTGIEEAEAVRDI